MPDEAETLEGFLVKDAAVVDRQTFAFATMGDPTLPRWRGVPDVQVPARMSAYLADRDYWGSMDYTPTKRFSAAGGRRPDGGKQAIFVGVDGSVAAFNFGAAKSGHESYLGPGFATRDVRFIDGHFYAVGGNDFIGRREHDGTWTILRQSKTRDFKNPRFYKIDGYSAEDLYLLAGRKLTIQHGSGKTLTTYQLPEDSFKNAQQRDFLPLSICAAPDGVVYVGSQDGRLLAGRAPSGFVQMIPFDPQYETRRIENLVWFQDTLWATFGSGLARLVDNKWELQDFSADPEAPTSFRFMDAGDGVLLVAGETAGWVYDGTAWRRIFGITLDEIFQIQNMEKNVEGLKALLESAKRLREIKRNTGP